jgi:8-oxo-dGTP pyrophosphatase MutT (NUDIX family)
MDDYPFSPAWQGLLERHGPLPRMGHRLHVGSAFYRFVARHTQQRDGEVVLAVRRPDARLLLHTKPFYPPGTWRMPTGGVEWGETPEQAAKREIVEETGLPAELAQLLGLLTYEVTAGDESPPLHLASAVFLSLAPDQQPAKRDPQEQISGYRWALAEELDAVTEQLRRLPADWRDWGVYRALAHEFVAFALR